MKLRKILPALFAVLIVAFSALFILRLNDKPTVIYPGKSFSLDEPQALASVKNLTSTLDAASFKVKVTGPYNRYYANTDGILELRFADYNIFGSDGEKYIITLMLNDDGNVCGTMRHHAENKKYFSEENHVVIGNEELSYLVTADGKSEIPEFKYIESILNPPPPDEAMIKATERAVRRYSKYLIKQDSADVAEYYFDSNDL